MTNGKPSGIKIKEQRQRRGWSTHQLARAAGISRRALQYIESGERAPREPTLRAIAGALEIPIRALIEDRQDVAA